MDGRIGKGRIDAYAHRQIERQRDTWIDGWIDRWIDRQTDKHFVARTTTASVLTSINTYSHNRDTIMATYSSQKKTKKKKRRAQLAPGHTPHYVLLWMDCIRPADARRELLLHLVKIDISWQCLQLYLPAAAAAAARCFLARRMLRGGRKR
eukprot:scaffold413277_cov17-Prasinocladus_malaysianus.AAC.1